MEALCASLSVPYAEGEVIEVNDDEALHAAVAEFGKSGGAILPAHAGANAIDLVDESAPTDQQLPARALGAGRERRAPVLDQGELTRQVKSISRARERQRGSCEDSRATR